MNKTLGYSALTDRVYIGTVNPKKPNEWRGEKQDVTQEFLAVAVEKFNTGSPHVITIAGEPAYEISVKEL